MGTELHDDEIELKARANRIRQRAAARRVAAEPAGPSDKRKMDPVLIAKGLGFRLTERPRVNPDFPWGWSAPAGGFELRIMPAGTFGFSTEDSAAENALSCLYQALGDFIRQRAGQAVRS